ncbi:MAG: hypothetical protein M3Q65_21475 [Chloroflexota bacterium]|nr:hypothetical protein [Chloroflexota bacterium]
MDAELAKAITLRLGVVLALLRVFLAIVRLWQESRRGRAHQERRMMVAPGRTG